MEREQVEEGLPHRGHPGGGEVADAPHLESPTRQQEPGGAGRWLDAVMRGRAVRRDRFHAWPQCRPVLGTEPGLQAGGVLGANREARAALLAGGQERVGGLVGRGDEVTNSGQAAVLATIDHLIFPGAIPGRLEPDEERLAVCRAAGGVRAGALFEADAPPVPGRKSDLLGHATPRPGPGRRRSPSERRSARAQRGRAPARTPERAPGHRGPRSPSSRRWSRP